jgi:cytochrome c peroxidase
MERCVAMRAWKDILVDSALSGVFFEYCSVGTHRRAGHGTDGDNTVTQRGRTKNLEPELNSKKSFSGDRGSVFFWDGSTESVAE